MINGLLNLCIPLNAFQDLDLTPATWSTQRISESCRWRNKLQIRFDLL